MTSCCDKEIGRMLHAYELNILSDEEADAFEAHLLECQYCFRQIKEFSPRGSLLRTSPRLKSLLQKIDNNDVSFSERIKRYLWPEKVPVVFKPALLLVAVLILSYPAYLGLFHTNAAVVSSIQKIDLISTRSSAEDNVFVLDGRQWAMVSFLIPSEYKESKIAVQLSIVDSHVIYENDSFDDVDAYGVGHLLIPHELLQDSTYKLSVTVRETTYRFYFSIKIK